MRLNSKLRERSNQIFINLNLSSLSRGKRVLTAKRKNAQADASKEESAINELVYELYGLTKEEIDIVEGKS